MAFRIKFFRMLLLILLSCASHLAWSEPTCKPSCKVYLTIDDGPLAGAANIMDVFSQEKVPVTLFMVGMHVQSYPDGEQLLKQAKALNHVQVGDHSYSHAHDHYRYFYSCPECVVKDMTQGAQVLGLDFKKSIPSRLPGRNVFRLKNLKQDDPYIDAQERLKEQVDDDLVSRAGFDLYGWDLEWAHLSLGKPVQSVPQLLNEIDDAFETGSTTRGGKLILLMHDQMFPNHFDGQLQLTMLIKGLQQRGYVLDDLRNY
ncbi:polysaccharide deacetylase family protein [Limnohabitans sp.]|uniref:polysaccharide deacetylase family protein n=1 Tax=Limnohabitans sp. TaxID=1907725 RepID=UPI00286F1CAD|nr:polysaccharide deacetylase family protein [Limnohabitans sp.]